MKLMVKAAYDKDRSDLWIISMFNHYDKEANMHTLVKYACTESTSYIPYSFYCIW